MNKKKRDKGFSLIEIIVVIAIMAVVTASAVSIYSLIKSSQLKSVAGKVNDEIGTLRSVTLTKSGAYDITIGYDSTKKNYYARIVRNGNEYSKVSLGNKGEIYCLSSTGNTEYKLKSGWSISIRFNKSDGSYEWIKCISKSGVVVDTIENYIYIEYSGQMKKIKMIKLTGKHYIE